MRIADGLAHMLFVNDALDMTVLNLLRGLESFLARLAVVASIWVSADA